MKNTLISAYKVKITLAVSAVFILAITLIMVNQSGAQQPTQSIRDLIGATSANNLTVTAMPKIAKPKLASVESLVSGLESRLKEQPDNLKGWLLLASSYHHIYRNDDAKKAFEQATALGYKGKLPYASSTANARSSSPLFSPLPQNRFLQQYLDNNQRVKHSSHGGNVGNVGNVGNQKLATNANSTTATNLDLSLDPALSKAVGQPSER